MTGRRGISLQRCDGFGITADQIRALGLPEDVRMATPEEAARWQAAQTAPAVEVPWRRDGDGWHAAFDEFIGRVGGRAPHFWLFVDLREADAEVGYEATVDAARFEVEELIR